MNNTYYRLFTHLDAPKRYLSLTIDELMAAAIGFSSPDLSCIGETMDFSVYQDKLSALSARFNLMVALVLGLLIANLLLASLAWFTSLHRQIEVTPFFGGEPYRKSSSTIDAQYLGLMSQNFIYSRLNVTPETVSANYQHLLSFVDGANQPEIRKSLEHEASIIQTQTISSHFVITDLKLNVTQLTARVTGILTRHVGLRALEDEKITYHLSYRYQLGQLRLLSFTQLTMQFVYHGEQLPSHFSSENQLVKLYQTIIGLHNQ